MDILAQQVDGIFLEENYRVPVECSLPTEYSVSSYGFSQTSEILYQFNPTIVVTIITSLRMFYVISQVLCECGFGTWFLWNQKLKTDLQ